MSAQPQTIITIYKAVTDMTYSNVYDYTSEAAFLSALNLNTHVIFHEQQYVRKNFAIELEIPFDEAEDYTYCVYDNGEGRGNEFAFIKEKIFCNFSVTRFVLVYDVWANYQKLSGYSNAELRGYVERCHQDYKQYNMIGDTNLEANLSEISDTIDSYRYLVLVVYDLDNATLSESSASHSINGLERIGTYIKMYNKNKTSAVPLDSSTLDDFCNDFANNPYIYAVYMCKVPSTTVPTGGDYVVSNITLKDGGLFEHTYVDRGYFGKAISPSGTTATSIITTNITVKLYHQNRDDAKCNESPYQYHNIILPGGELRIYNENKVQGVDELNEYSTLTINVQISFSSGGIYIKYTPVTTGNVNDNNYLLTAFETPILKNIDSYEDFMANNASYGMNMVWGSVSGALKGGTNAIIHGSGIGSIVGATGASFVLNSIDNAVQYSLNKYTYDQKPDNPRFGYSTMFEAVKLSGKYCMVYNHYLDENSLNMLHNKFVSMGYPLNKYVDINYRIRTNYDFIKAYDITTTHRVCNEERAILNQIFNKGVRIWHNPLPMEFGVPSTNANNPMRS